MKVERISYSVSGLKNVGTLIYDEAATKRPLHAHGAQLARHQSDLDRGRAHALADHYVVFMADMYGEGNAPKGTENPMEFLAPLMKDAKATAAASSPRSTPC